MTHHACSSGAHIGHQHSPSHKAGSTHAVYLEELKTEIEMPPSCCWWEIFGSEEKLKLAQGEKSSLCAKFTPFSSQASYTFTPTRRAQCRPLAWLSSCLGLQPPPKLLCPPTSCCSRSQQWGWSRLETGFWGSSQLSVNTEFCPWCLQRQLHLDLCSPSTSLSNKNKDFTFTLHDKMF